jgi:hypothetical protein
VFLGNLAALVLVLLTPKARFLYSIQESIASGLAGEAGNVKGFTACFPAKIFS